MNDNNVITIDQEKLRKAEAAMAAVAAWAKEEAERLGKSSVGFGPDEGRRKIMERAAGLFGSALMAPEGASIIWDAFVKGVHMAFGVAKPVTDAIRSCVIACRGEGVDSLPVRWEELFYLDVDLRSTLAVMRDDGISPLQATCPQGDPVRAYVSAWLCAIDDVSDRIAKEFIPIGGITRSDVSFVYHSAGWTELLGRRTDEAVRNMVAPNSVIKPHHVIWQSLPDVPMVYGDERKRDRGLDQSKTVDLDPFQLRCALEAEINNRVRQTDWKSDPASAGAMKFLTGLRNMLQNHDCTGRDVLKMFYNIFNGCRLFDTPILPDMEHGPEYVTVFNLLQNVVPKHPELIAAETGVFSGNVSALVRVLRNAGCMPEGPHDSVRHERLTGWLRMKTEMEDAAMRMRCMTPSSNGRQPQNIMALLNPPLMSAMGNDWDMLFRPQP